MHLSALFQRLAKYGLKVNKQKCRLGVEELDFLAHHITKEGFHPVRDKVEAIHSDRTTVKSGNNSRDNELNELPENDIDVIYQYQDLVQAPTKTRFG